MRINLACLFTLLLGACAAPTASTHEAAVATGAASTSSSDAGEVVCRTEKVIGSLVSTERECKTRAQWSQDERDNREDVQQRQSAMSTGGPH